MAKNIGTGGDVLFGGNDTNSIVPGQGGLNPTGMPANYAGSNVGNPTNNGLVANPSGDLVITPTNQPILNKTGGATNPLANVGVPGLVTPTATPSTPLASPDTTGTNVFGSPTGVPGTSLQDLNVGGLLGFPAPGSSQASTLASQLDTIFGKGMGQLLVQYLGSGAGYNPQVAQALMNQNQPNYDRQVANLKEAFGASGDRYSSSAAIGLGDLSSSYALGQQGILANLYQQSAQNYKDIFSGVLDTAHLEEAHKTSIWDVLSGLLGLGFSSGLGSLLGKVLGGGGGAGSSSSFPIPNIPDMLGKLLGKIFGGGNTSALPGGSLGINSGGPVQAGGGPQFTPSDLPSWLSPTPSLPGGVIDGGTLNPTVIPGGSSSWTMTDPITGMPIQDSGSGTDTGQSLIDFWNSVFGTSGDPFGSGSGDTPTGQGSGSPISGSGSGSSDAGGIDPFNTDWTNYISTFGGGGGDGGYQGEGGPQYYDPFGNP